MNQRRFGRGDSLVTGTTHARRASLALALLLAGCPGPEGASLTITSPSSGSSLSAADDTDPGTEGLQIAVSVDTENVDSGTSVQLLVDDAVQGVEPVSEGRVTFTGVSLSDGTHRIVAATVEGGIRSPEVVVAVSGSCFSITFVTPVPGGDAVRLSASDDTDGEPCGTTFETSVVVATSAPSGAQAQVFVNGTPRASTTVSAGVARFDGVALDNRGPSSPNTLRVAITSADGVSCGADFPTSILVQCAGPSCAITHPDTDSAFLGRADDSSAADGFQTDFEVTTDSGVQARLIIDGDESSAMSASFGGTTAIFGNVALTETLHRVVAECVDDLGNRTRSGVAEWTVDVTECGVGVDNPTDGQVFVPDDDIDPSAMGVQVAVDGTAGSDCTGLRVGVCSGLDAAPFGSVEPVWSSQASLATAASQELCAQTVDRARNVSETRISVRFATDAPALEIALPSAGTRFNQSSDLTPGDSTCAQDVEVYCDIPGETVELRRSDISTLIGSAPCTASVGVPSPYTGMATFSEVVLPNREDGMPYSLEARATVGRLEGVSTPVTIFSDCNAPTLSIFRPMCGQTLNPNSQDEDPASPGFQYSTRALNSDAAADVTLTIRPAGGGAVTYMRTLPTVGTGVSFADASYGSGGMLDIEATATDSAGNVGRSPACSVAVLDLPSVTITSPAMGQVLTLADDCNPDAALRIRVQGTTDAAVGSSVVVRVGSAVTNSMVRTGGVISVCAQTVEGSSVPVVVEVTDARGTGSSMVTVVIDSSPPTTPIGAITATVVDRRDGIVRFEWTAVADAGSTPLASYEMRCATTPITTDMDWDAARSVSLATVPGTPGTVEREDVNAFRPGEDLNCVIRGFDGAANPTPLGPNVGISIAFLMHVVDGMVPSAGLGDRVTAVGDVNGDLIDDVLTGGDGTAYLWYGSASGLGNRPSVTISSSATGFGDSIVGLGDFNGDGLNDFAIGAPLAASNQGQVFVMFGRSSASPFPASCNLDLATCPASLTFNRPAGLALSGWVLSASDFDGDGVVDLVVGAPGVNSFAGEVYVVRGGSHLVAGSTFVLEAGSSMAPRGFVISAPAGIGQLGSGVAGLGGSVVGAERHEIVLAAPGLSGGMASLLLAEGQAYSGSGLLALPASALTVFATDLRGRYTVVAPAGDFDGDGALDVAVYSPVGGTSGRVDLFLGDPTGFDTTRSFGIVNDAPGTRTGDEFGNSIGAARHPSFGNLGDLDRDGRADLFVGSRELGDLPGAAALFYGTTSPAATTRSEATTSLPGADGARQVGLVGDVNGDGFPDAAIGEATANGGAGRLTIVY